MKHIQLKYRNGGEDTFTTTDANAATMVERFCHGGQIWIERFEYRKGKFKRYEDGFVAAKLVARIVIDRDDSFDESKIE